MPNISVAVEAALAPARLDALTRDLMHDLSRVGVRALPVEAPADPGQRGVMISVGKFIIDTFLGDKTASAVLEIVKAYLTREKSMSLSVVKPDGTIIKIDANNVSSTAVAEFLGVAKSIIN